MWKRLDESISLSEKLASLSWAAFGTWAYLLSQTDTMGRFPRDARVVKAKCMTLRYDLRLELVEEALLEIERAGLLHRYDAEGKPFLVLHNYRDHNPPGALGRISPKYPAPPSGLCSCVDSERRASGAQAPDVLSSHVSSDTPAAAPKEPRSSPMGLLFGLAEKAKIPNAEATQRKYFEAWIARSDYTRVQQILSDPWTVGKTVNEIQDHFFPKQKPAQEHVFTPAKTKCANCGGTGKVAGAVENGAVKLVACRRCAQ